MKDGKLGTVEVVALLGSVHGRKVQRPDADIGNFERIKNVHSHGICSLISEMSPNSAGKPLVGLSDVDRLLVVIVKSVNAPSVAADVLAVVVARLKKGYDLLTDRNNVRRRA